MNARDCAAESRAIEGRIKQSEQDIETGRWRQAELAWIATVGQGMAFRAYAEIEGHSAQTIKYWTQIWDRWGSVPRAERPRFSDADSTVRHGYDELTTTADRSRIARERQAPTRHEDKVEMAAKLLADHEVTRAVIPQVLAEPSRSQRIVENSVTKINADRRKAAIQESQRKATATAAPLPTFMVRMVAKINEWAIGMQAITDDDLDGLPDGTDLDQVIRAVQHLSRQCKRWEARLDRRPSLEVIEGHAS